MIACCKEFSGSSKPINAARGLAWDYQIPPESSAALQGKELQWAEADRDCIDTAAHSDPHRASAYGKDKEAANATTGQRPY
jgi:hypothetical protein